MRRSVVLVFAPTVILALAMGTGRSHTAARQADRYVVEVFARGLEFEAPDRIPSGWTTFRLHNESGMTHFALVQRLPEGVGLEEHQTAVAPVFQAGMDRLNNGEQDAAMAKFGDLPSWYSDVVFVGGPGLTSPGRTAETTVFLQPGTYLLECYVKTDGVFHSFNPAPGEDGMVHELTVTEAPSGAPEPVPNLHLRISSKSGIRMEEEPSAGPQTVAVHFEDQTVYEHFLGHDVHLVRLRNDTDLETLGSWMNWMGPDGLETPAPADFLGGTEDLAAGETAYFTVNLAPGRYAWISEVPSPGAHGMLKLFTIKP